jgi:large subunit ribosomal protein L7/L12
MAVIVQSCLKCKHPIKMYVGQHVLSESLRLTWYKSYSCPYCGTQIEEDGNDITPAEIHKAILEQEGTWLLDIEETGERVILVVKILRKALNLSLYDAMKIKKTMPGKAIEGTKVEMNRLKQLLERQSFKSILRKKLSNDGTD